MQTKYILYAEDDIDDQELLTDMMKQVDGGLRLSCVNDGYDVIHYLENLQPGSNYPCIIILDINMPGLDGMQTLKLLKNDDRFAKIPVVIFSTSSSTHDKELSASLGAREFFTKPVRPNQLEEIAARFAEYCHSVPQQAGGMERE